ncbi:MAG: amidohydrolase family protein, partial [Tissierellia bacterium]|nr:amidohydrolase family protein [Tissierellia bacterium]
ASDGLLNRGQGHPRAAGTFPRVIGKYVRDEGKLDLLDQLKKMTKLPAKRLKLENKGELREGMDADIVIFDYDKIIDCATFQNPTEKPKGIEYVIINGKIALEKGSVLNNRLGRAIRRLQ